MLTAAQIAAVAKRALNEPVSDVVPMACLPELHRAALAAGNAAVARRWRITKRILRVAARHSKRKLLR